MAMVAAEAAAQPVAGDYQIDCGNLLIFQPRDVEIPSSSTQEECDRACLESATSLVQALANSLFSLPCTVDRSGRIASLPEPTTRLPREKPLPKPRPPTKWELFAQKKGIQKRKRSKLEYDDNSQEWRRRYGYKRVGDENEIPIIEAKPTDDPNEDPFAKNRAAKKQRVVKNETNRLQNLKQAAKAGGKGALPSTLQLAATQVPITGVKEPVKRLSKDQIGHAAGLAATATASIGKFDKKLPGEKAAKHQGKHRKFLPVAPARGNGGQEKLQMQSVLDKVISRHDTGMLDVNKAVSVYKVQEEGQRAKENEANGGKKRKFSSKGRSGKGAGGGKRGAGAGSGSGKGKGKFAATAASGKGKKQKRAKL